MAFRRCALPLLAVAISIYLSIVDAHEHGHAVASEVTFGESKRHFLIVTAEPYMQAPPYRIVFITLAGISGISVLLLLAGLLRSRHAHEHAGTARFWLSTQHASSDVVIYCLFSLVLANALYSVYVLAEPVEFYTPKILYQRMVAFDTEFMLILALLRTAVLAAAVFAVLSSREDKSRQQTAAAALMYLATLLSSTPLLHYVVEPPTSFSVVANLSIAAQAAAAAPIAVQIWLKRQPTAAYNAYKHVFVDADSPN